MITNAQIIDSVILNTKSYFHESFIRLSLFWDFLDFTVNWLFLSFCFSVHPVDIYLCSVVNLFLLYSAKYCIYITSSALGLLYLLVAMILVIMVTIFFLANLIALPSLVL